MTTRYLFYIAAGWALIGLLVGLIMRRRGHSFSVWAFVGLALGPLAIPLAIERARFHGSAQSPELASPSELSNGFDMLVGLDGSSDSRLALDAALRLFGSQLTSVRLVSVLDYDAEQAPSAENERQMAQAMLEEVAEGVQIDPVSTALLFGRPSDSLTEHARREGFELIVVGARGRGATEALFGSVTSRLVGGSEIPIFVGPRR